MTDEERRALFVRLPVEQARRVEAAARRVGRTKQDYVAAVLAASLDAAPEAGPGALRWTDRSDGPGATAGATAGATGAVDEVLTLQELATLLKVGEGAVMDRVVAGDLPGRRFGDQWRFSRAAVLEWLAGSDADRRQYGFRSGKQATGASPGSLRRKERT